MTLTIDDINNWRKVYFRLNLVSLITLYMYIFLPPKRQDSGFITKTSKYDKNIILPSISLLITWSAHFPSFKMNGIYPQRNIDCVSLLGRHDLQSPDFLRNGHEAPSTWGPVHGLFDCPALLCLIDFFIARLSSRSFIHFFSLLFPNADNRR